MDPAACRVIYIDDRFNTERWISRDGLTPISPQRVPSQVEYADLPPDLQANIDAFLSVFNQVYVCRSGRAFSVKLSELHEQVAQDCTPILACFDVGAEHRHDHFAPHKPRFAPGNESPAPSPAGLRREITFSAESDESYGLQLLSRIASDLQVEDGVRLIIPVAIVQPQRKDSYDQNLERFDPRPITRAPYGSETIATAVDDHTDIVDPRMMLSCLDAGATDVVRSPLDKAAIMGLTVHAYRIYKAARNEQTAFMSQARQRRKASWVGMDEEKPYAYLREAMVKKLLKGICEPQDLIEDYQHRNMYVAESRKQVIAQEVGKWGFCGHDFSEDELVYAGYVMLDHALQVRELEQWKVPQAELLRFMQGCQAAYNSFVLYHNFRHAVDVLQSLFYFLVQIGTLPPYPLGSEAPPKSHDKSAVAKLLGSFEALTLLIAAIGHDVGHPGVNNMFLVKLNAPLAQLYNDQSVLEAFHCAAYSQILRRHWPVVFNDKRMRKLMITSILATDMGVHSDYMHQLGQLQEKIAAKAETEAWAPKDVEMYRTLTCGLLIKCADISNVARPWLVAEKWTHLLQREFAHQGEMESAVGMETTLFGGPPELGNMLKLANGQIGFMTIFAHPLFANVTDIIPAMGFAADEILTNKGVWFTRAEQEKKTKHLMTPMSHQGGSVSPRTQSPVRRPETRELPPSPLRNRNDTSASNGDIPKSRVPSKGSRGSSSAAVTAIVTPNTDAEKPSGHGSNDPLTTTSEDSPRDPGVQKGSQEHEKAPDTRRDTTVSMRAGSQAIPLNHSSPADVDVETLEKTHSELSKFSFATSSYDEPVRTYDPNSTYAPDHPEVRASAPANTIEHQKQRVEMAEDGRQTTSSDTNTAGTSVQGVGQGEPLTPSHTNTTSVTSVEHSEQTSPMLNVLAAGRGRATSAPLATPAFKGSRSGNPHGHGSKTDVRALVHVNGEMVDDEGNFDRKQQTKTLGRKRSKMKLKDLAFWKKRDKSSERADRMDRVPADSS